MLPHKRNLPNDLQQSLGLRLALRINSGCLLKKAMVQTKQIPNEGKNIINNFKY